MRKTIFFILCTVLFCELGYSQDKNQPWVISLGTNAVNVYSTNAPTTDLYGFQGFYFDQFYNIEEHWNFNSIPVSYLKIGHFIGKGASVGIDFSLNNLTKIEGFDEMNYTSFNGYIRQSTAGKHALVPYIEIGGGITSVGEQSFGTFNAGVGLEYWFLPSIGVNYGIQYKHSFASSGVKHFQHILVVSVKLPFTNEKSITREENITPQKYKILEKEEIAEIEAIKKEKEEKEKIIAENTKPIEEITALETTEKKIELDLSALSIKVGFDFESYEVRKQDIPSLKKISDFLIKNTDKKILIKGYTSNDGSTKYNIRLSFLRAKSVKDKLVKLGTKDTQVIVEGRGEENPISNNLTEEGRSKNRRVEFKLID